MSPGSNGFFSGGLPGGKMKAGKQAGRKNPGVIKTNIFSS